MFFLDLSGCGPAGLLRVLYFFKLILDIVFIIVPIGLIVMLIIDFAKMTISGDESVQKKMFNVATKRLLTAVIVFFVPMIVSIVNEILGDLGVEYSVCYNDISIEAIEQLEMDEETIENAKKNALFKLLEKQEEEKKEEEQVENIVSESGTYIANGTGCDGLVYYENGIFYKPSSAYTNGTLETKGSAAYGYNKYFYDMLTEMISDAKEEGYTISLSTTEYGAWRPYEKQLYFYNCYINQNCNNGNLAANPGTSNHGWGIASDLQYGNNAAIEWAHENAINYGLKFTVASENWHIAPAVTKTDDSVVTKCK